MISVIVIVPYIDSSLYFWHPNASMNPQSRNAHTEEPFVSVKLVQLHRKWLSVICQDVNWDGKAPCILICPLAVQVVSLAANFLICQLRLTVRALMSWQTGRGVAHCYDECLSWLGDVILEPIWGLWHEIMIYQRSSDVAGYSPSTHIPDENFHSAEQKTKLSCLGGMQQHWKIICYCDTY